MKITQHVMRSLHHLRRTRQAWLGLFVLICVLAATLPVAGSPATPDPAAPVVSETGPSAPVPPMIRPGIYVVAETGAMDPAHYHLTGSLRTFNWSELHIGPSQFNWGALDQYLETIAGYGKAAAIGISTYNGRCCGGISAMPAFIRSSAPNSVLDAGACTSAQYPLGGCINGRWLLPRYWDTDYLNAYGEFIQALGNRYKNDARLECCLLYTSDAADERSSVDIGGRRIIKKKYQQDSIAYDMTLTTNTSHKRPTTN